MLSRRFKILTRMQQRQAMLLQLAARQADQGTQAPQSLTRDGEDALILSARKQAKRSEHGRVRESFDEWLDKGDD